MDVDVKVTVDSFVGSLSNYDAVIAYDPAKSLVTATKLSFNFNDVKTGKEKRDKKMHVWQETEKFPDGVFTLEKIEAAGDGKSFNVSGNLFFHGMNLPLSFPLTVQRKLTTLTFAGEAVVDTEAYGLPILKMMGMIKVDPKVKIRFELVGSLPATK